MNITEKEIAQARAPALVLIFENIRNMFLCIGLALVGLAVAYVPGLSFLGWPWSHWIGLLIVVSAGGLLVASVVDLWVELTRGAPTRSPKFRLMIVPLLLAYSVAAAFCYGAAIKGLTKPVLAQIAAHAGEAKEGPKAGSQ